MENNETNVTMATEEVKEMDKIPSTTIVNIVEEAKKSKNYCDCCMADSLCGCICNHGPKDAEGKGIKCSGDVNDRVHKQLHKNTEVNSINEPHYYVANINKACVLTEGDITACTLSKEDLTRIINGEAVLIIDHIVIGVAGND